MAQTLTPTIPAGMGNSTKLKFAILRLNNSAAETTYTLTAALAGMEYIACVMAIDEVAAAAVLGTPTAVAAVGGLYSQVALTFTAGDELTLLVIGV